MSSAGVSVAAPQAFYCYQCNSTVNLTPTPNSDLSCPNCNGGFLEEFEALNINHNPGLDAVSVSVLADPFLLAPTRSSIILSSTSIDLENPGNFSPLFASRPVSYGEVSPAFNAFAFLQGHLQNLRASGANVQVAIENHPSDPEFRLPDNFGDYFLGPGLEQLIQQLAENDPNRYGTPPASKKVVEGLPDVTVTEEVVSSNSSSCAVCMNDFEVGSQAKQMPCKHMYHSECLLPWLELHNSCPICRLELPTDDPDYENRKNGREQGTASRSSTTSGGSRGGEGSQRGSGSERRFRILFPWPLRAFGSSGEDNDGVAGNDIGNNNNNSDLSSGNEECDNHGSEARQESLD